MPGRRSAAAHGAGASPVAPGARQAASPAAGALRAAAAPTTRERGNAAEDAALAHLLAAGLRLEARNYRTPGRGGGEIDLVMRERGGTVVFVEVRARRSRAQGGAAASVGALKQQRIVLAARHWLAAQRAAPPPCRFDVVAIEAGRIEWLRAAFDAG